MSIRKQGDIYSAPDDQNERFEKATEVKEVTEHWRRDYLKNRFWSFFLGFIVFAFASGVIWLLIQNYLSLQPQRAAERAHEARRRSSVTSRHNLSTLTDWVIDFREPLDTTIKDVDFNIYWLKRAAYHVINGEQAFHANDPATAREQLGKALEIFPDLKGIHFPLGNLALLEENYEEAIKSFEKAAAQEEEMTYRLALNLGAACIGAEDYENGENYLLEAIELQPNKPQAQKNLAMLYRKSGKKEEASLHFEKYLNLVPDDMAMMQSYAMHMTANGKWKKAAELLRKLNKEFPDVAPLFFLRAQAEAQLGNKADAIKALKRATQLVDSSYALAWLAKDDFDALRTTKEFLDLSTRTEISAEER
ncbi:tetratricopeptide repeat protein [Verrucomicrobiota bacterium]